MQAAFARATAIALVAVAAACSGGGGSTAGPVPTTLPTATPTVAASTAPTPNPTVTYLSGGLGAGNIAIYVGSVSGSLLMGQTQGATVNLAGHTAPAAQSSFAPIVMTAGSTTTVAAFPDIAGFSAYKTGTSDSKCVSVANADASTGVYTVTLSAPATASIPCGATIAPIFASADFRTVIGVVTYVQVAR